jgi:hypothetical protein
LAPLILKALGTELERAVSYLKLGFALFVSANLKMEDAMNEKRLLIIVMALIVLASVAVPSIAQEPFNINCIRQFDYNWHAPVQDVSLSGDYAYLACNFEGLRIIDVSRPGSYQVVGHLDRGQITAVAIDGQFAYLGSSEDSLFIVDIASKTNPVVVAAISLPGYKSAIRNFDSLVYICTTSGLKVFDVSNPSEPNLVWNFQEYEVHDASVKDNKAYIACGYGNLRVFDISNIANPVLLGEIEPGEWGDVLGVSLYGNFAVLACGWSGIRIYDLTSSQLVSQIDTLNFALWVKVQGDYAYLAYGYPECPLAIINISNPSTPELTSVYYPPEDIATFDVVGDKVFVADYGHGLRTVDISDKVNPLETVPYNRFGFEKKVVLSGSNAYAMSTFKLTAIDVSDPLVPSENGYFESNWELCDFKIVGDIAYVLSGEQTELSAVDFSNPSEPEILDQVIPNGYHNYYRFAIYGNYLYLIGWESTIIYDISNPSEVTEVGTYDFATNGYTNFIFGHYLVVEIRNESLAMLDLTNPLVPELVSTFPLNGMCFEIRVKDNVLYALQYDKLDIIDISNPAVWRLLSEKPLGNDGLYNGNHCELYGNSLYLASEGYGLVVYDITIPASPRLSGYYDTPGTAYGVAANNDIAIVSDFTSLGIYDCSDAQGASDGADSNLPTQISLLSNYPNPFNSSTVVRFENTAPGNVAVDIIDLLGRKVAVIANENFQPGLHSIRWDGSGLDGRAVSSGQYFVRVQSGDNSKSLPVTLLK